MALTYRAVQLLAQHLRGARVLAFGFPDMLITRAQAKELLGIAPILTSPYGANHKWKTEVVDTEEVMAKLNVDFKCVDIVKHRGVEQVVDLNDPWDWPDYLGSFDLVLDAGTIEHCANIGQALKTAALMVKLGGRVFHSPPMTMVNHGFYNVCPTLLHDFYTQNGWLVEYLSAFDVRHGFEEFPVHPTGRTACRSDAAIYFMAKRLSDGPLKWPVQTKYMVKV
jgi:hypothetical protein